MLDRRFFVGRHHVEWSHLLLYTQGYGLLVAPWCLSSSEKWTFSHTWKISGGCRNRGSKIFTLTGNKCAPLWGVPRGPATWKGATPKLKIGVRRNREKSKTKNWLKVNQFLTAWLGIEMCTFHELELGACWGWVWPFVSWESATPNSNTRCVINCQKTG